jgi:hypothetical protein
MKSINVILVWAGCAVALVGLAAANVSGKATADGGLADSLATMGPDSTATSDRPFVAESPPRIIVYYFHGEFRCENCLRIEAWTASVLSDSFAADLESGVLQWAVVNIDEPQNDHFIDDFSLTGSSAVLVELEAGRPQRWEILDAVWTLLDDKDAFREYIRGETQAYLDADSKASAPE